MEEPVISPTTAGLKTKGHKAAIHPFPVHLKVS